MLNDIYGKTPLCYFDGNVWRDVHCWKNYTTSKAILVCGGPSLNKIDLTKLKGPGKTIFGVNNTYPKVIPDYWIGMDVPECYSGDVYFEPFPKIMRGGYQKYSIHGKSLKHYRNLNFCRTTLEAAPSETIFNSLNPLCTEFYWSQDVFSIALQLIMHQGFKEIFLVGCDLSTEEQDYHTDQVLSEENRQGNQKLYNSLFEFLSWFRETALMNGVYIYSTSPESRINTILKYVSLDELNQSIVIPKKKEDFIHVRDTKE